METRTQAVSFASGSEELQGYLARPVGSGPFPGLLVIHEIFGLNDNMKEIARRLAEEGYAALAVDLFTGRNRVLCIFRLFAGLLFNSLDHGGIHDLKSALTFFSEQPGVDTRRLGAIGFCMGGGLAIAWACTDDRLIVIAPFYGMNPRLLDAVARSCPVVGSYPGDDFTAPQARKLAHKLREHRIPHDIRIYPGAKHSFFNDHGPTHDPAAASDAWQRTLAYFNKRLG